MIKNKNYVGVILTFLVTALLLFTSFISFSYIPTKADETNSDSIIETTSTVSLSAQDIVNGVTLVGYYSIDNALTYNPDLNKDNDYLDSIGIMFYIPHEYFNVSGFEYGVIIVRKTDLVDHNITNRYFEQLDSYELPYRKLTEDFSSGSGIYKHTYGCYSYMHLHFSIENTSYLVDDVFVYYVKDLSTGEVAYSAEHMFNPSKITKDYIDSIIDLNDYISVETYNNEISKLKSEIEQLKKGTKTENTSSNVFMIVSLVFVLILVVAVVSALMPKNKMKK